MHEPHALLLDERLLRLIEIGVADQVDDGLDAELGEVGVVAPSGCAPRK